MSLTPIRSLESARKNFSWIRRTSCLKSRNQTYLGSGGRNESNSNMHVYKVGIKRFWAQEAEMSLTPISWLESARIYFSWTRRTWCLESRKQTFLGQEADMSLIPIKSLESAKENFSWTGRTWCLESRNETFLGSGGRNESNTLQFGRIGLKKFSHEFDVHDVSKVGIKRFWAHEAEMGKTAKSSLVSARKKFFTNPTYIMCRK